MNSVMPRPSELNRQERLERFKALNARTELTAQQAADHINRMAGDARAVTTVLNAFMQEHYIGNPVAVNNCRRARQLLQEATEFLDAAVDRLDAQ